MTTPEYRPQSMHSSLPQRQSPLPPQAVETREVIHPGPQQVPIPPVARQTGGPDVLTVVHYVHHQSPTEESDSAEFTASRELLTKEEPFSKRVRFNGEWQPLIDPKCWIDKIGYVELHNDGAGFRPSQPSEEERQQDERLVLEVGVGVQSGEESVVVPVCTIHPKFGLPIEPVDPFMLFVRCRVDSICRATLHVYPE